MKRPSLIAGVAIVAVGALAWVFYRSAGLSQDTSPTPLPVVVAPEMSVISLKTAAEQGDLHATAALGEHYQAGKGVKRDLTNAAALFQRAAEGGDVTGQFDLAYLYETGRGVSKNQQLAAKWYGLAAQGGDPTAQFLYGQRCLGGLGLPKDPVEGMKWLRLSAAQGQADATATLQEAEKEMTMAQIADSKKRAASFVPRAPAK